MRQQITAENLLLKGFGYEVRLAILNISQLTEIRKPIIWYVGAEVEVGWTKQWKKSSYIFYSSKSLYVVVIHVDSQNFAATRPDHTFPCKSYRRTAFKMDKRNGSQPKLATGLEKAMF